MSKPVGSGSGPRQDGCTCGEIASTHFPRCPVRPFQHPFDAPVEASTAEPRPLARTGGRLGASVGSPRGRHGVDQPPLFDPTE